MYSDSQDEWHRKSEQDYTKHRQKSRNVLRNDFSKTFYIHASVPAKNNIKELPVKGGASVLGCGEGVKGGGGGGAETGLLIVSVRRANFRYGEFYRILP